MSVLKRCGRHHVAIKKQPLRNTVCNRFGQGENGRQDALNLLKFVTSLVGAKDISHSQRIPNDFHLGEKIGQQRVLWIARKITDGFGKKRDFASDSIRHVDVLCNGHNSCKPNSCRVLCFTRIYYRAWIFRNRPKAKIPMWEGWLHPSYDATTR